MVQEPYLLVSSAVLIVWGIMFIIPLRSVLAGFGDISLQNRRIFAMAWIGGG